MTRAAASSYEAVILAAGRGSRLAEETDHRPKALLPIGPRSKSDSTETCFLRRQIELLKAAGVDKVVVVVGYKKELMAAEIESWAPWVRIAVNPTPEIKTSGSLHSFQFAARSTHGVLDGTRQTILMDADIVYHRSVLRTLLDAPPESSLLVSDHHTEESEEVLVWGTRDRPRYLAKGLNAELTNGAACLGEAAGVVKFAPGDHKLVRATMDWMLGDPNAPEGSLVHRGFGPAKRATEHEELTQRFMHYEKMRAATFETQKLPFMEVDNKTEYEHLRSTVYPQILEMEASA